MRLGAGAARSRHERVLSRYARGSIVIANGTAGPLGSFSFDARGDITESPVTILRVDEGGGARAVESVDGGVVERVVRPSPALVAPG